MTAPAFGRFFLPGPTEVLPEILAAQASPMIGHRDPEMETLLAGIAPGLQRVFRTARPVYVSTSSATGFMEAGIRNAVAGRVLALVNGAFSERFHKIALACGREVDALSVPWGQGHDPGRVEEALRMARYDAVTVVHSETSTGALNPIREITEVAHRVGDVAVLVDSVTGVAGAPVETDAWDLDFVLTGSQKALALPPGLAFAVAHPRVLERARGIAARGTYFDLLEFEAYAAKHQTPNTPAVSLLYALAAQLARIERETIPARWARHAAMAERTWGWVDEMRDRGAPLAVLAPRGYRSPTVTCITLPEGHTGPAVAQALSSRGFTVAPGYGKIKNDSIRIGHMGDHTVEALEALLAALAEVLEA